MVLTPKSFVSKTFIAVAISAFALTGCSSDPAPLGPTDPPPIDTTATQQDVRFELDGQIISIPSPVQTAFLIEKSGAKYDERNVNDPDRYSMYSTKPRKALNLGVYGADLGYVTIYNNNQQAMSFLSSVQTLAGDLNIAGAFDREMLERLSANMGNKDSMLVLTAEAFRYGDAYLKDNDRDEVASLILAGGWIEALYFATKVAADNKSPEVITRIGEQKQTLDNLIMLIGQCTESEDGGEEILELHDNLIDLQSSFDGINYTYVYEKPINHPEKKLTVVNCKSEVTISDQQLQEITDRIKEIRNQIVG
jgi:hypothetical protein